MRRRAMLILMAMAALVVLVSGVAWAATVQCEAGSMVCLGNADPDTITGTSEQDYIRGLGGGDLARGMGDADIVEGGKGKDTVKGGGGSDYFLWGGEAGPEGSGPYTDVSDDYVYGGSGHDGIKGGYALGGVDHVFGEDGDDTIQTYQRGLAKDLGVVVTKEIINCGAGDDTVAFDEGKDEVAQNCETLYPVGPGGEGAPIELNELPTNDGPGPLHPGPSLCPYSAECMEGVFSETRMQLPAKNLLEGSERFVLGPASIGC